MSFDTNYKIVLRTELMKIVRQLRTITSKKIVFTNGCFNLLHAGHIYFLNKTRSLGDFLILGLNTDLSLSKINKKYNHPYSPQKQRAEVLAGLAAVDLVTLFDEPTPYELIKAIIPDILTKGEDWNLNSIIGAEIVNSYGGRIICIPLIKKLSTTSLIERIKNN